MRLHEWLMWVLIVLVCLPLLYPLYIFWELTYGQWFK